MMAKQKQTIDQQLQRLDQIRQSLENADRPIEELVQIYAEGIELARNIREQLHALRLRIITLSQQHESEANSTGDD
ncbi:MAG: exodeoxyribonuclease VII small subunit [Chlorobi bacterium]|nr:exodeoxyribonuclease VII small subunit [Chlorobiota bacterium]